MNEPDRNEPHAGTNQYADPGAAPSAATTSSPPQAAAPGDPINLFLHKLFHTSPPLAAATPSPPRAAAAGEHRYPVEFTASAGEYFRIWIVNLALTILTLGIYSAWAKVRKKRYFYGHTLIDGDSFEYRGQPLAILKGRLIAVALAGVFYGASHFYPSVLWLVVLVVVFIAPWLIVRSLAFNAYNTAYRNVRLHFRGTYWRCLKLLLGYGLLVVVTFGLGYPYLKVRMVEFAARNHHYGATQFNLTVPDLKPIFFRIYSWAIVLGILYGLMLFVLSVVVMFVLRPLLGPDAAAPVHSVVMTLLGYALYMYIFAYLRANVANATLNNLAIGPVRIECTLHHNDLFWLYLVNILAIIATLGLATPWAAVRTMRYRAENTTLVTADGLDQFVAAESSQVGAAGEEVGEMFNIDIAL